MGIGQRILWIVCAVLTLWTLPARAVPARADQVKGWRFAVIGDHRGDNKNFLLVQDPDDPTKLVAMGYNDDGITKPILADIAAALAKEHVEFVLDGGDLVTKWQKSAKTPTGTYPFAIKAGPLFDYELGIWEEIWKTNSGNLPIFPVRGNQEWTCPLANWYAFIARMPGIGTYPIQSAPGLEGLTFSFTYKNCLFIGIDQYASALSSGDSHLIDPPALEWIKGQLLASDRPFKFVWSHAPAFEVWDPGADANFTTVKDGLATPYAMFTHDTTKIPKLAGFPPLDAMGIRDDLWNTIAGTGAEYFCGHEHLYARAMAATLADPISLALGTPARQTIIGNGGAPAFKALSPDYVNGPYAETYTALALPTDGTFQYVLGQPLIVPETPVDLQFGYIVVEVRGSHVTARYMAEAGAGAGFHQLDSWTIAGAPDPN